MKTGIIGLPQVGKTSLFRILTKAGAAASSNPREAHIGVAKVPDDRLDRLAAQCNPKKLVHASIEYVDVGAIGQDALRDTTYITHLRTVDALAHVVRAFDDPAIPHVGENNPLRDIQNVDFDLIVSDLGQTEKRLERLEKDLKKGKTAQLEQEFALLQRAKAHLETEKPLREMTISSDEKKLIRGFMFLSEKPILYVLNISESTELGPGRSGGAAECRGDGDLRQGGSGAFRDERGGCGGLSFQLRADGKRTGAPGADVLQAAGANVVLYRGRGRVPGLDDSGEYEGSAGGRGNSFRS
jgi:ribosome-binding ATPase YchF (GTP1/OBG family)